MLTVLSDRLDEPKHVSPEDETLLQVDNLRKSFVSPSGKIIDVLRGVSLSAMGGQAVAIIGASGAGKSTLLHLIGGLETADEGTVRLQDAGYKTDLDRAETTLRRDQIGFVFQFHHLLPDLSAAENVALPLMISGVDQRKAMCAANEALNEIGLGDRLHHAINYLSGGEQQRVAVARALILKPEVVLADEPTGNLDALIESDIRKTLIDYAHGEKNRRGILIVATHNERLARACDRVLELKDGRLQEL